MGTPYNNQMAASLDRFNLADDDKMGLGRTPSVRSAELVAGARAELMRDPEILALSRISGRIFARMVGGMAGSVKPHVLWFFPARMMAIETLVERIEPDTKREMLIVDVAAGLSTRGLNMARRYPKARIIEVDLPSMVAEKQRRLKQGHITIPPNLSWREADLGHENLIDVLEGERAQLITSEGLTLYLNNDELQRYYQQIYAALLPGGNFIVETYSRARMNDLRSSSQLSSVGSFILRMVGNTPGFLDDLTQMDVWMQEAGLTNVTTYNLAAFMQEMGQPSPIDFIDVKTARRPLATDAALDVPLEDSPASEA